MRAGSTWRLITALVMLMSSSFYLIIKYFKYSLLSILVLSFPYKAMAAEAVGQILFIHGVVTLTSLEGETRTAVQGASVFEGDSIVSDKASSMQLKMVDGGYLAVRPSTVIKIDNYRFKQDGEDKVQTSLLRGGLRSITGSIGQTKKESFKIRTPVATMGIRGTDLEVFYFPEDQSESVKKGVYLRINSGKGYIQTYAGVQFVGANQTGYAVDSQSLPELLSNPPAIFNLSSDFNFL